MLLDVRPVLYAPGKSLPFALTLDLRDLEFGGRYPIREPVEAEGVVRNRADVVSLELEARTVLDARCDRCGKAFPLEKAVEYRCVLAEEAQSDESGDTDIVLLDNGQVDAEDLARTAFILAMDTKTLCSPDCKGLCPRCGADLNEGPCGCTKETDPRWAVLAQLLDGADTAAD